MNESSKIKSLLPNKIYYEFANHKLYSNKTIKFNEWSPWNEWDYPEQDLDRFNKLILDNIDIIKDKTVIDFACLVGFVSLACLHIGAKFVTATNIKERQNCLDIANEIISAAGFNQTQYSLVASDIHNTAQNTNLCTNVDTVILAGIMYHVHDHYQILESITRANPSYIIVDTVETEFTLRNEIAAIEWVIENVSDDTSGYYQAHANILIGYPNSKWYDMAFTCLGYKKVKETQHTRTNPKNQISTIHVYQHIVK